jgi:hypothetical protein
VLTAGFVTVFGLFGAVITKAIGGVQEYLPWATIVIGVGLVGLGIYLLTGRELVLDIPKLQRGGADGTLLSMYLFGISYAVASLSCTIGPFLAVTSTTFRNESYLSGVLVFVLYGVGMGIVVGVLTVAVALAKDGIVAKFRSLILEHDVGNRLRIILPNDNVAGKRTLPVAALKAETVFGRQGINSNIRSLGSFYGGPTYFATTFRNSSVVSVPDTMLVPIMNCGIDPWRNSRALVP